MPSVHVLSPVAGFGNRLDLDLVCALLEGEGFDVTRFAVSNRTKSGRAGAVLSRVVSGRGRFDLNLFLAPIFPEWIPFARKNVLIPNAEGFAQVNWLSRIDLVLAKTRLTETIFRDLGCRTEFTSFTSHDHLDPAVPRDFSRFFHSCSSQFKGTVRLLETWRAHPEWPELVAVINNNDLVPADLQAPNLRLLRQRLTEAELRQWQNSIGFHLCTSEAEGFGHYIMEALSCRAVTLTTDGPPMNELIQPGRGILIPRLSEAPAMRLSRRYLFDPAGLAAAVDEALALDPATRTAIGEKGREFFLENDRTFRRNLIAILKSL
jgi:glycosyltransferase involved in cell wall biosynthesis